ncbi:Uncharacterized protein PCOAH_00006390 [Plasmodium coatneyi]|uniref:Pv-fam-d protein n=1 Tax=Plasmodium coatneyi TaxID=208452 RepID=A0A1B1DU72_9APIC|nr:Uncharacterized protein PCOAH_00006390 [Plasmodium coatneyi]ANQ06328.1 Uncharacterized protein PCOAH_00006390 [Plasmodium coatneyi]
MNVKIRNFLFTKIAVFVLVLSIWNCSYEVFSFCDHHNGRRNRQNDILLGVRASRLLFGEYNVVKETEDNSLKGRFVNILEKDGNEFSRHLSALKHDENFPNQLNFCTHYGNEQRPPNALMRDYGSECGFSLSNFYENSKKPLYELKRSASDDSIFGGLGVADSYESIDHISNDSLDSCGLDIVKNEKHFTMANAISEQEEFDKLIREHKSGKATERGIYGLLKKVDRKVESEILTLMKYDLGYDNNKEHRGKCRRGYKKLLNDIKKYRIFVPLMIFGTIAVVLMPHIFFGSIVLSTAAFSTSFFKLYFVSLLSSFILGTYYQIKYEKCSNIVGRFLKNKKRPCLKNKVPPAYVAFRDL